VRTALWEDPAGYGGQLARQLGIPQEHLLAGLPQQVGMLTDRLIEPAEVAALVVQLCSPRAASIVGADYVIDCGAIKAVQLSPFPDRYRWQTGVVLRQNHHPSVPDLVRRVIEHML